MQLSAEGVCFVKMDLRHSMDGCERGKRKMTFDSVEDEPLGLEVKHSIVQLAIATLSVVFDEGKVWEGGADTPKDIVDRKKRWNCAA
jgi:hypothetical protein